MVFGNAASCYIVFLYIIDGLCNYGVWAGEQWCNMQLEPDSINWCITGIDVPSPVITSIDPVGSVFSCLVTVQAGGEKTGEYALLPC